MDQQLWNCGIIIAPSPRCIMLDSILLCCVQLQSSHSFSLHQRHQSMRVGVKRCMIIPFTPQERCGALIRASWINQNNTACVIEPLHFTGAFWLSITKRQIVMMPNKIRTESMPSSMVGWNCYWKLLTALDMGDCGIYVSFKRRRQGGGKLW